MSKNKKIKSISFNITNAQDRECLERIKDANFSGYVKGLILADIKKEKSKVHRTNNGGMKIMVKG